MIFKWSNKIGGGYRSAPFVACSLFCDSWLVLCCDTLISERHQLCLVLNVDRACSFSIWSFSNFQSLLLVNTSVRILHPVALVRVLWLFSVRKLLFSRLHLLCVAFWILTSSITSLLKLFRTKKHDHKWFALHEVWGLLKLFKYYLKISLKTFSSLFKSL